LTERRAREKVNGPEASKISCIFWQVIYGGRCSFVGEHEWLTGGGAAESKERTEAERRELQVFRLNGVENSSRLRGSVAGKFCAVAAAQEKSERRLL
jgi:hypothetical protein